MADITEIAVAAWRLEKWLDNVNVERKMAAKSALRAIKKYLQENEIEVVDLTGNKFDVGLAVSVVNNESDEADEDKLVISEMVKPIIKEKGAVIQYGQVILGEQVKQPRANRVVENKQQEENSVEKEAIAIAAGLETLSEKASEEPLAEEAEPVSVPEKKDRKLLRILAWASVVGLQVVIIMLLVRTAGQIKVLKQTGDNLSQVITSENMVSSGQMDLSSIESQLSRLEERLSSVEKGIADVSSDLTEVTACISSQEAEIQNKNDGSAAEKEYITYTVQSGDTLIAICNANGVDYYAHRKDILAVNGISDTRQLMIGQEIKIPRV